MSSSEDIVSEEKDYGGSAHYNQGPNNMVDHAQLAQHHYAQAQIQQGTQNPRVRKPFDYGGNPLARIDTAESMRLPAFGGEFQPGLYKGTKDRKFANPAPLGLCAFALTTFVLSLINLNTRGVSAPNIVVALAYGYGGLVQLLAGMWYGICPFSLYKFLENATNGFGLGRWPLETHLVPQLSLPTVASGSLLPSS